MGALAAPTMNTVKGANREMTDYQTAWAGVLAMFIAGECCVLAGEMNDSRAVRAVGHVYLVLAAVPAIILLWLALSPNP